MWGQQVVRAKLGAKLRIRAILVLSVVAFIVSSPHQSPRCGVLSVQCRKRIHARCTVVKVVTLISVINFACSKCEGIIVVLVGQECSYVVMMWKR